MRERQSNPCGAATAALQSFNSRRWCTTTAPDCRVKVLSRGQSPANELELTFRVYDICALLVLTSVKVLSRGHSTGTELELVVWQTLRRG